MLRPSTGEEGVAHPARVGTGVHPPSEHSLKDCRCHHDDKTSTDCPGGSRHAEPTSDLSQRFAGSRRRGCRGSHRRSSARHALYPLDGNPTWRLTARWPSASPPANGSGMMPTTGFASATHPPPLQSRRYGSRSRRSRPVSATARAAMIAMTPTQGSSAPAMKMMDPPTRSLVDTASP